MILLQVLGSKKLYLENIYRHSKEYDINNGWRPNWLSIVCSQFWIMQSAVEVGWWEWSYFWAVCSIWSWVYTNNYNLCPLPSTFLAWAGRGNCIVFIAVVLAFLCVQNFVFIADFLHSVDISRRFCIRCAKHVNLLNCVRNIFRFSSVNSAVFGSSEGHNVLGR